MATFGQIPSNVNFNNFQVVTSSTRPSTPAEGDHIYETDTDLSYFWNGSVWAPVSNQLIASTTLGVDTASIDFQNIPATFTHLNIILRGRSDRIAADDVRMEANGDTVDNSYRSQWTRSSSATVDSAANPLPIIFFVPGSDSSASLFGHATIWLYNYSKSDTQHFAQSVGNYISSSSDTLNWLSISWRHGSASAIVIDRLTFKPRLGTNLKAGSRIEIYGMR